MATGTTRVVAEFVAAATFDDLPDTAVAAAKAPILDALGVTVAGSTHPLPVALMKVHQGAGAATVIGHRAQLSPTAAALVNGAAGHALDYDDVSWRMNGHPSVTLLPAILAAAEERLANGRDVLLAYLVGCEVAASLGRTLNPAHLTAGWHPTGTVGTIAAAAATAVVLRLDAMRTSHAIAMAASMAAGLRQNFGTDAKPLHAGRAAQGGLLAAALAAEGCEADEQALEGRLGYLNAAQASSRDHDPANQLVRPLGELWDVEKPGLLLKVFPSCGSTHNAVAAALRIVERDAPDPAMIERVVVRVHEGVFNTLIRSDPQSGLEAKFSMEYCVATALTTGALRPGDFEETAVRRASIRALMARIEMVADDELTRGWTPGTPKAAEVVVTVGESEFAHRNSFPPGSPEAPMPEAIDAKFEDCMATRQTVGTADEVRRCLKTLEELDDVRELTRLLAER